MVKTVFISWSVCFLSVIMVQNHSVAIGEFNGRVHHDDSGEFKAVELIAVCSCQRVGSEDLQTDSTVCIVCIFFACDMATRRSTCYCRFVQVHVWRSIYGPQRYL